MVQTPKGAANCSPKNKGRQGKIQTVRTVALIGNIKPHTQQNFTSMKPSSPLPQQEPSNASTKVSSASKSVRNCVGQSPEVQDDMSRKANGESHLKAEEAGFGGIDSVKHDPDSGLISDKNDSQGVLKNEMSLETKGVAFLQNMKITPLQGDGSNHSYDSTTVELSTTMRVPFAVNNCFCSWNFPTGLTSEKADTSPFVDSPLKENS